MTQPRKEQINILRSTWSVSTYTGTGGTTSTTIAPSTLEPNSVTQLPGGSASVTPPIRGIVTSGTGGFVKLRRVDNGLTLDDSGAQIYGRLTYSSGNYILSYKKISGSSEVTATLPSSGTYSVQMMFPEVMEFGEIPTNSDVILAKSLELNPSPNNISGDLDVTGDTTLGDSSSDTITLNARFLSDLIPSIDDIIALGSSSLRFVDGNFEQYTARADNTDTVKSIFDAAGITATGTNFKIDGNSTLSFGTLTTAGITIGRTGITTTINGTLRPTGNLTIGGDLTVNGLSSVINGDLTVTGILSTGNILNTFTDLTVLGNTILGDANTDTINFNARMISSILPSISDGYDGYDGYDIGFSSLRFRHMHATEFISHADDIYSNYSFLDSNTLFSSVAFDIDGYNSMFIGTSTATSIHIGHIGITTTLDGYFTIDSGSQLNTAGSGNINLPNNTNARFYIEGVPVTSGVTAVNLTTLTNGSNADALHTHTVSATTATTGEAISAGAPVAYNNSAGNPRLFRADADGSLPLPYVVGIALSSVGSSASLTIKSFGEASVPDGIWDVLPAATDVGSPVYLSTNVGMLTLTAPTAGGTYSTRVGTVSSGGSGNVKIIILIGDNLLN